MCLGNNMKCRGFEVVANEFRKHPNVDIQLPKRSDSRSAGYDFYAPCDIVIQPNEKILVFSDIKAYMQEDEVLLLYVRSSIGIKKGLVLSNGTGIIDSSYYSNPSNDGNIGIALHNTTDKVVEIKQGERIIQGIFTKYLVADEDNVIHENRTGGIGSSNRPKENDLITLKDVPWLNKEKKAKLKELKGSANSKVDLNKVREDMKYGDE